MKSISNTLVPKQLSSLRCLHLGQHFPTLAKEPQAGDPSKAPTKVTSKAPAKVTSKVSAAVRASSLPKGDQKTEQVPEELRAPAEAIAAAASSTGPKRSELDQRKERKSECASQLQTLMVQRNTCKEITVQCVPFVKMSNASDNPLRRCFETPEQLLAQERNPLKLAKSLIKLKRELQAEKEKTELITQNYLELKAELYARHCAMINHSHAASPASGPAKEDPAPVAPTKVKPGNVPVPAKDAAAPVTASSAAASSAAASSASGSSQAKPVTAPSSGSPAQDKSVNASAQGKPKTN